MINQTFPITPPFELMNQWYKKACKDPYNGGKFIMAQTLKDFASSASQWGWDQRGAATESELQQRADQELEACCEWIRGWYGSGCGELISELRIARRPNPPSLKDQALEAATRFYAKGHEGCTDEEVKGDFDAICRALERLKELEAAND